MKDLPFGDDQYERVHAAGADKVVEEVVIPGQKLCLALARERLEDNLSYYFKPHSTPTFAGGDMALCIEDIEQALSTGRIDDLRNQDVGHWPKEEQEQVRSLLFAHPDAARQLVHANTSKSVEDLVLRMHSRGFTWSLWALGLELGSHETTPLFDTPEFYTGLIQALLDELYAMVSARDLDRPSKLALLESIVITQQSIRNASHIPSLPHEEDSVDCDRGNWPVPHMLDIIVDYTSLRKPDDEIVSKIFGQNTFSLLASTSSIATRIVQHVVPGLLFEHVLQTAAQERKRREREARRERLPDIKVSSRPGLHMTGWYGEKTTRALQAIGVLLDAYHRGDSQLPKRPEEFASEEEYQAYSNHPNVGMRRGLRELVDMNLTLYFMSSGIDASYAGIDISNIIEGGSQALLEFIHQHDSCFTLKE